MHAETLAAMLTAHGFELEVAGTGLVVRHDGELDGKFVVNLLPDRNLILLSMGWLIQPHPSELPRVLELVNEVNREGIVKLYIDKDHDLIAEMNILVFGPYSEDELVRTLRTFHRFAEDAAQPFAAFQRTVGEAPGLSVRAETRVQTG